MTSLVRPFGLGLLLAGIALAGWQETDIITNRDTSDITAQSNARSVACDAAGNIHVVWRGRIGGIWQLWYSHLDAGDTLWAPSETLTNTAGGVCDPSCLVGADQSFYVGWNDSLTGTIRLMRRDPTGQWDSLESLAGEPGDSMVSLASDNSGVLHVVWRREGSPWPAVYYASYRESGWSGVDTVAAGAAWPSVAGSPDGTVMVTWSEATSPNRIMSRRRVAGEWQPEEVVYNASRGSNPSVTCGGDSFYVAWLSGQFPNQHALVRACSASVWSDTTRLNVWRVVQPGISIAADVDGALCVAWSGYDAGSPSMTQVQYRARPAGGSWQSPESLTTAPSGDRMRVSVSARQGSVQVAWSDWPTLSLPPAVRLRRYEQLHDVGALYVLPDTVDSGTAVAPRGWLKNCGDFAEVNIPVWLSFSGYCDVETLPRLAPDDVDRVQFDTTILTSRGLHAVLCSTALAGDAKPANDAVRDSIFARVRDVSLDSILAPDSAVYDTLLTPCVRARNCGNVVASATVYAWIDSAYYRDSMVVQLSPGGDSLVTLDSWRTTPGFHTFRCSVAYVADARPENNTLSKQFRVVVTDVGVSAILSPSGTVDSGSTVAPFAVVRNYGTTAATFSARLAVDTVYSDTALVTSLVPSESAFVAFDAWTPTMRGTHVVRCSTMLGGDRNPGNDLQSCSVFVRVRDAAPVEILSPAEIISRGEVRPRVRLANHGNQVASIPAKFDILHDAAHVYSESTTATVAAGDSLEVEFLPWLAHGDTYEGVCMTSLDDDMRAENDTVRRGFIVARVDAGALAIRVPRDTISEGCVEPRILVANYGYERATFHAHFTCLRQDSTVAYHDSEYVVLDTMRPTEVTFREWRAGPGDYGLMAKVKLGYDENPHNDSVCSAVYVESLESRHWRERASVPRGPWGRRVKDGGSLVAVADGLLALKGANTRECYRYLAAADSWAALAEMPPGDSGHRVRAGAALCWDGNDAVFALKGTGTHEFWRYDIPGDSWHALASMPEHTRGARCGCGLAFVPVEDTDMVFMVKGSSTRDFFVYWVRQNEWHARRPLPTGPDSTTARYGTCLALLGGRIFCLKGGTTEFYEYFPDGDSWFERAGLPRLGRGNQRKKPAKGAALASDGSRFLYAFKGGGVNEFWSYDSRGDSWSQLDDIPRGNYRRKVGRGGTLAWLGGRAYALKGGGSNEFWCFDPLAALAGTPESGRGAEAEAAVVPLPFTRRAPAIMRCGRLAEYPVPNGTTGVVVIDATGRVVARRVVAPPLVELRFSRPGVYFVLTSGDYGSSVAKTMVVR